MPRKVKSKNKGADSDNQIFRSEYDKPKINDTADSYESMESSEEEDEDDFGELATEAIDEGINTLIQTLKTNPDKLLDPNVKFFPEIGEEGARLSAKEKPMYLKDYHREMLLKGEDPTRLPENESRDETYVQKQSREKAELLNAINDTIGENEDGEDDFLVKRTEERIVEPLSLPDPEEKPDEFLNAFLNQKAWIPKDVDEQTGEKRVPTYGEAVDEDSEGFDDIADKFESAYNFRFEDAGAAEIVSYARDQNTLRRKDNSTRQKQRDQKREKREAEEQKRKLELAKVRKQKVSEVSQKLERIASLIGDDDIAAQIRPEDLEGEWDNDEWDKRMQKLFNDEFYAKEGDTQKPEDEESDHDVEDFEEEAEESEAVHVNSNDQAVGKTKSKAKSDAQSSLFFASKQDLRKKAEEIVDSNPDLLLDEISPAGATFRYREVEAESYGLSAQDILLADDKALNQFASLKHLASYREPEKMQKDRKRFSKKKRLREWRTETFGDEAVDHAALWEKMKEESAPMPKKQKKNDKKLSKGKSKGKKSR